jgi:hypothetical protein
MPEVSSHPDSDRTFMKTTNVLLLILDQWGLHEIGIQTCLKPLPIILDGRGLHEKHEGSSADFRSKLV